jgi:membrane protein
VLLIPFLLLFAVGITSALREQTFLHRLLEVELLHGLVLGALRLAPVAMNVVALGILYAVMPNRRPHPKSILIGALVAGCAWQLVQVGYVSLQVGVARANAIYGALAQLPVTLVWIYVSWAVVLAGAQLAAVIEYGPEPEDERARDVSRWAIALHVLVRAAERFRRGEGPVDLGTIAHDLDVNSELVAECVGRLRDAGTLVGVDEADESYVLARDPATIELSLLAEQFGEARAPAGTDPRVARLLGALEAGRREGLLRTTLADLVHEMPAGEAGAALPRAAAERVRLA